MKKVYITGVSGTGKTTIARELVRRGFYAISIDEVDGLCSWIDQETGRNDGGKEAEMTVEFVDKHDWICDISHLNKLLEMDMNVAFVLGMATNQKDFLPMFDKIFVLQCAPETFLQRIENRTDNNFGKDKDVQAQVIARSKTYGEEMASHGAVLVNTDRSLDEVVDDILAQVAI